MGPPPWCMPRMARAYESGTDLSGRKSALVVGLVTMALIFLRWAVFSETVDSSPYAKQTARKGPLYGVMLDAGSSGSRVHAYRFGVRSDNSLFLEDELFKAVKPGVSSFAAVRLQPGRPRTY